jgi:agmatinase
MVDLAGRRRITPPPPFPAIRGRAPLDPDFDPDAPGDGTLFGLPHPVDEAGVVVLPVPFDATTSFGHGTAGAPEAVLEASQQVDLSDPETGEPWRAGIALDGPAPWLAEAVATALADAARARAGDGSALARVNAVGDRVADHVEAWTEARLARGQIPAVLGGDHSVPLGAFRAAVRRFPGLGILHVDAHADLRDAYEGFRHSHASIFFNALQLDGLDTVVQVGLRDLGTRERALAAAEPRVVWWTDDRIATHLHEGEAFGALVGRMLAPLPENVWVSFDVDGLDPALCPGTGTPVPGGLTWREAMTLLRALGTSGRRIVGFDLCEVGAHPFDANVGARLLYKLSGWALATRPETP